MKIKSSESQNARICMSTIKVLDFQKLFNAEGQNESEMNPSYPGLTVTTFPLTHVQPWAHHLPS